MPCWDHKKAGAASVGLFAFDPEMCYFFEKM